MKPRISAALIVITANLMCLTIAAPQLDKIFGQGFFQQLRQERQLAAAASDNDSLEQEAVVVSPGIPDIQDFILSDAVAQFTSRLVNETLSTPDNRYNNISF